MIEQSDEHFEAFLSTDSNKNEAEELRQIRVRLLGSKSLKVLDLSDIRLESIQFLSKVDLQSATNLSLDQNLICNFRALRKINCPNLKVLSLFPLRNMSVLYRSLPRPDLVHKSYFRNFSTVSQLSEMRMESVTELYLPILLESKMEGVVTAKYMMKWDSVKVSHIMVCGFYSWKFRLMDDDDNEEQIRKQYNQDKIMGCHFDQDLEHTVENKYFNAFKNKFMQSQSYWHDRLRPS